mgnify:CR=1 FL=1
MITVRVRLGGGIAGIPHVETRDMRVEEGTRVQELLDTVVGDVAHEIDWSCVLVAVNGRRVGDRERREWVLKDGDVLSIIRVMPGG